ncbi:TPA: serine acetyltransferase [Citrobacter sedlakii]|nr:serine acetyltransferase [Citrobacter sedlakii]HCA7134004.1 serine acetyltransferase [Citrobacter sedlakii]HCA7180138.1 serine acetyltransferase [Citrobacter sedlakii]
MSKNTKHYHDMKEILAKEILGGRKKFSWRRIIFRCWKHPAHKFICWWRIANCLYCQGGKCRVKWARRIHRNLVSKYNTDIGLGAQIGAGFKIYHFNGIVICPQAIIGDNLKIRQNTTIGLKTVEGIKAVRIGNNVEIGANTCIIGDDITIGDNVMIGAMSFVNKDIPSNCIFYTKKESTIIQRKD